jgi:hypothetical protein
MTTGAIIAAAAAQREVFQILSAFRTAGAISPDRARPLAQLGLELDPWMTRLVGAGVIVQARPDRFYLDESAFAAYTRAQRGRALIAGVIAAVMGIALAVVAFLATRRAH